MQKTPFLHLKTRKSTLLYVHFGLSAGRLRAQMPDMHGVRCGAHADALSEADDLCAKRP